MTDSELKQIEKLLREFNELMVRLCKVEHKLDMNKRYMTIQEVSEYTGYTISTIYHLTSRRKIRYFKPNGKTILIMRKDLEKWIESYPVEALEEIKDKPFIHNHQSE